MILVSSSLRTSCKKIFASKELRRLETMILELLSLTQAAVAGSHRHGGIGFLRTVRHSFLLPSIEVRDVTFYFTSSNLCVMNLHSTLQGNRGSKPPRLWFKGKQKTLNVLSLPLNQIRAGICPSFSGSAEQHTLHLLLTRYSMVTTHCPVRITTCVKSSVYLNIYQIDAGFKINPRCQEFAFSNRHSSWSLCSL